MEAELGKKKKARFQKQTPQQKKVFFLFALQKKFSLLKSS
jgi:hypothetical protein